MSVEFFKEFEIFLLALVRITSFFMSTPIFSSKTIPVRLKAALAVFIAIVLLPVIRNPEYIMSANALLLGLAILKEMIIGVAIGFSASMLFASVQLAGEYMGVQIGFGIVNVVDPESSVEVSIIGQIQYFLAIIIFLGLNGHHQFIKAIYNSFLLAPVGTVVIEKKLSIFIANLYQGCFILSLQLAAPIIATLVMTTMAFGMVARTVPKMNIFIVGMPLKIIIGIMVMALSMPFFVRVLERIALILDKNIYLIIKLVSTNAL